ncbi:hypothetical protein EST38_g13875 [Candolleomyces aberdarensis]|uniref:Uncharacterized protein n=1 Tax=Candolleomyces aberdarensis TaxID=2316362 RepID=A0A4Q2D151_9AGAR|nr:hypothetical protein EST38_g13875 [Candolleomyces aberdarensis]
MPTNELTLPSLTLDKRYLKADLENLQDALSKSQQTIPDHLARQDELSSHIERSVVELEPTQSPPAPDSTRSLGNTRPNLDS